MALSKYIELKLPKLRLYPRVSLICSSSSSRYIRKTRWYLSCASFVDLDTQYFLHFGESKTLCNAWEREKEGDELFGFGFKCTLFRLTSMCVVVGNCFAIVFEFYCRSAALPHTRPTPRGRRTGGKFSLVSFLSLNCRFYVVLDNDDHSFHRFSFFSLFMPYATTRSIRHIKT